jgi:glyoxylase-like metal-dependent hydrolase (beta-lactamase superfamily II)
VKHALPTLLLFTACGGAGGEVRAPATPRLNVDVHAAAESDVNAYVISDGTGTILVDATRSSAEARKLLALARSRGGDPSLVFITHGHPDHYLGIGALLEEVPRLRVVVATPEIVADILGMSTWMDGQGWLDGEPAMKPAAFDYAGVIEVLDQPRLRTPGGAVLEVRTDYPATEAEHMSTLYSAELGALFTSDLAYHDVHLWMGPGVTPESAAAWQATLDELAARTPAGTTVYPGHGAPTDASVFAATRAYIDDLLEVARASGSDADAAAEMIRRYPEHRNRDFLLAMSVAEQRRLAGE